MEPSIFIPHFLRACLFALLPGKDTAERSEQPEEGGSRSLPICSFIFRLLNSIIQQIGLRGKPAQAPIRYGSTAQMSSVLQLPVSLMLQLFAEVPSCPGALLVCLFSGFPGCSGGPQPRLKTLLPWWCRCFSLLGLRVCSQKWERAGGHSWSCPKPQAPSKREGEGVGRTWGALCSRHLLCPEAGESLWKCSLVPVCSLLHLACKHSSKTHLNSLQHLGVLFANPRIV